MYIMHFNNGLSLYLLDNQTLIEVLTPIINLESIHFGPKLVLNKIVDDRKYKCDF